MSPQESSLSWFTPLPPARNGIADYAGMLLSEIAKLIPCHCYCEDPLAITPAGVDVRDPLQAFRILDDKSAILHQIGNNRGHVFTIEALRQFGGITSLHDLSLLYVHELGTAKLADLYGRMRSPARDLGDTYARHWKEAGLKTAANYVLFDMVGEILSLSSKVIVHSEYARRKLTALHGDAAGSKIVVIPHFAKSPTITYKQARREIGIDPDDVLILTSGFATRVKRFDWLIEALDSLQQSGRRFRWIHAGEEQATEYPLTKMIDARTHLSDVCHVTGYLSEEKLNHHIAAADIVVNLRFPSVGESSGTLARAFSAGRCCVVNDTAAYSELPRDAAVHIPVFDTVGALVRALDHLLGDRSLRETFGRRARHFANKSLSIDSVAKRYVDVVLDSQSARTAATKLSVSNVSRHNSTAPTKTVVVEYFFDGSMPDLSTLIGQSANEFRLTVWFKSAERFAEALAHKPALVQASIGPHIEVDHVGFVSDPITSDRGSARMGIYLAGRACG